MEVGQFNSAFVVRRFELAPAIEDYQKNHPRAKSIILVIVFTDQPRNLGQVNFTSRIREEKPRFNYGWDWMIRLMQIGIWDGVRLEVSNGPEIESLRMMTGFDARRVPANLPNYGLGLTRIAKKALSGNWKPQSLLQSL